MSLTKSITATISFVGAGYQVVAINIPLSGGLEYGYQDRLLRPVDNRYILCQIQILLL